jgi:hypothetical protein
MTAVSLAIVNGTGNEMMIDDSVVTTGTTAPTTGDIMFCWNLTDTNSNTVTRLMLLKALEAFEIYLESNARYTTASEG